MAALAAALTLLSVAAGCSGEAKEKEPTVTVQAATAQKGEIEQLVISEAIVFPRQQSAITPKVNAPVKKFLVNRGSKVHAGQLLAVLENRDLAAAEVDTKGAYEQAQAQYSTSTRADLPQEIQKSELDVTQTKTAYDAAQKVYDSRQELYKQGAIPRKTVDDAAVSLAQAKEAYDLAAKHLQSVQAVSKEATLKGAAGQLSSAKGKYMGAEAQLGYTEIRSPIDGVVTDRPNYAGEMPASGTPLITVMDTSVVIAKAHMPQDQAAQLKVGNEAAITAAGVDGEIPAKVTLISPALDPNSTTVEVWVQANNADGRLRPGSSAHLEIVAQKVEDAIVIPSVAVLTSDSGTSVMVIGSDGKAHQQDVKVGIKQGDKTQIVSGLKPGDQVVTVGAYGLPDKTKVKVEAPAAPADKGKDSGGKKGDNAKD